MFIYLLPFQKATLTNNTIMIIGVPKEIKNNENRVALTPAGVTELLKRGHEVYVQSTAGEGSGFTDDSYKEAGANILPTIEATYQKAEMIMKVKEPIEAEYSLIKKDQLLFTYFHFASYEPLTHAMIKSGAVCLAYETVEKANGTLPLLIPMSEVAGRMSIQQGAKFLEKPMKGRGILLGGVPGVRPAKVMILGGGVVGTEAAKMAAGLGADVIILDLSLPRLRYLDDVMPANVKTLMSNEYNIRELIKDHDLIIGAVLIPGAKAPKLITKDMLKEMRPGTVMVDVAVDQGGCFETTKPTTHQDPVFIIDDVIHYCVANMPGAVPYTSTLALTNATLPYAIQLAGKGWKTACRDNNELKLGLNVINGKVVYQAVSEAFNLAYTDVNTFLN
ncbi:Alanine dehydrogenase [Imperialibacter sp. EC-SDR9]|nr:Alanine dehydrogenase [Imperialibacter sp. 89]CAD5292429.1 Alanine dehydrogenase [Imperialibacter sp. 75]VVS99803.1 Alanine dehydrogenase [Imperialibacter sp. EC-SDR9]